MKDKYKKRVINKIEEIKQDLFDIADYIFENPEFCFKEYKAHAKLTAYLEENGFNITKKVAGLDTAFKAVYNGKKTGYNIGLFCEYDAVYPKGHCCGHNLMAVMGVGAGIALREIVDEIGGTISVFGTPAEEGGGGKIIMLRNGAFEELDAAIILHPANETVVNDKSYSVTDVIIEFFGVKSHAATYPEDGISALNPMLQVFNIVNGMRHELNGKGHILGVIKDGGENPIYTPDYTKAHFTIRSFDPDIKKNLVDRFLGICEHVANITNTGFKYQFNKLSYEAIKNNKVIENLLAENFICLGEAVESRDKILGIGSTDMGNVTRTIPSLQSYVKLDDNLMAHSDELMQAASDARGKKTILVGAKAMAMTTIDLLNKDNMEYVKQTFDLQNKKYM
ncbi:amidohydrolase [Wukongibacter sp. M2B1]|uniref:amidohydrolase n=1 Tax=Wukongibacter sp. M2B1 TaxID=3088895 RepID=UPI003D7A4D14